MEEAIKNSPGLAFIVYPTIVNQMKFPQLWAALFFIMLIIIGCDTLFALVEGVVTAMCDRFPHQLRTRKTWVTLVYCLLSILCGIFLCFGNGLYVYTLFDSFVANINLLIIGISELVIVSWVYGVDRFRDDIEFMLQTKISVLWKFAWAFVSPLSLFLVLVASLVIYERASLDTLFGKYTYPIWCEVLGWVMVIGPFVLVPLTACSKLCCGDKGTFCERLSQLSKPHASWGPRDVDDWYRDRESRPHLYEKRTHPVDEATDSKV